MGPRRAWRWWLALAVVTAIAVATSLGRRAAAWAIVQAPNYEGAAVLDPSPDDVERVIRAEVGPPAATLEAWVLEPEEPPVATTLVLHGIRDRKSSMIGIGRALRSRGHRVVLVDLRGHGGSSGRWLTYGVVESRDLAQLLDHLEALGMIAGPVGVYGPSYGGAVALQLAAIDRRVERVASLSTFASLREVVPPYAQNHVPGLGALLPGAAIDLVVDDAGELGRFSPDAADTRAAIARTHAHVLLVHGDADRDIPFDHARRLYAACPRGRCELLAIEGGGHTSTLGSARATSAAVAFLTDPAFPCAQRPRPRCSSP